MKYVTDKDLGLQRFIAQLQVAKRVEVVIGLQEGDTNGGQSIAEYGAYNEYGTGDIPERSFMRTSFDENNRRISQDIATQYDLVKQGKKTVYAALGMVGLRHEADIKTKIGSNIQPANSPITIARKGSSRTLIDTGAMLAAVRYIIRIPRGRTK